MSATWKISVARLLAYLTICLTVSPISHSLYILPPNGSLQVVPAKPRCAGLDAYTWYATVQHCMEIKPPSAGNNCPLLNDTLLALVYYEGNVVQNTSNMTKTVASVKAAMSQRPKGFRILQAQNVHQVARHPDDNILPAGQTSCKNGTKFSGVWWDHAITNLADDNKGFFEAYQKAGGVPIDGIVLDPEIAMEAWSLFLNECSGPPSSQACCTLLLDSIQNDRRFPPLLEELVQLGFKKAAGEHWLHDSLIPYGTSDGGYTENLAIWEGWSNSRTASYYNKGVLVPAKAAYPNILVNNYGSMTTDVPHCLPDQSGYTQCRYAGGTYPTVVGNQQAPCMYVWMNNASLAKGLSRVNQTATGTNFDFTPWNGLKYGINLMRMNTLSSSVPVVPWVAYKNDSMMSPLMWKKALANSHFYQEHILHLAMHNPPSMLYFNPCWAKGYCDASWDDNLLFANMFHELTERVGCVSSSRSWEKAEFVSWDAKIVATGMSIPGGITVWRVTTFDGKTESHVQSTSTGITISVGGASLNFTGGKSLGAGPNAPYGVWIETHSGEVNEY